MHNIYVVCLVFFWGLVAGAPEAWAALLFLGAVISTAFFAGRWGRKRNKRQGGGE